MQMARMAPRLVRQSTQNTALCVCLRMCVSSVCLSLSLARLLDIEQKLANGLLGTRLFGFAFQEPD